MCIGCKVGAELKHIKPSVCAQAAKIPLSLANNFIQAFL